MSHPSEDHWNPKSLRLFAYIFAVDTPLRAKPRLRPELLFERQASRSAAEVHMTVPRRDTEWSYCIQLFRRRVLRGRVHYANGSHGLCRPFVQDRSRMIVDRVALLLPVVTIVRIVDLFANFARGMKRLVPSRSAVFTSE
jgi:hypothetical protein